MRTEDGYIIQQCLDGNAAAFGFLVKKYKEPVYALAYSHVHNFHDAQDITQEVFIKAYRKLRDLRRWDSFMGWLCRITNNTCKDWLRSKARRPDSEFVEDQDLDTLDSTAMASYHEDMVYESIQYALDSLPELYSRVLILRYFGGMTVREISRFLAVSPGTIDRRLREARTQLKEGMLVMMSKSYEQHELPATFMFRIVEAVKRVKINPMPRMAGVPWGLSLATGIIITILGIGMHHDLTKTGSYTSISSLSGGSNVLDTGEFPVDVMRVNDIPFTSARQSPGDGLGNVFINLQNALLMAPQAEGGTWTRKADMPTSRFYLSTCAVDGKIYAIGGGSPNGYTPATEEYDPTTDIWVKKKDMPTIRGGMSACTVNGKIYVMGGYGQRQPVEFSILEEYDPENDKWTKKADMPTGRQFFSAEAVDGKIYAIGGWRDANALSIVEEYDPEKDVWAKKTSMPDTRFGFSTSVVNGKIYVMGGYPTGGFPIGNDPGKILSTVEEYDPKTDTWTKKENMPTARMEFSASSVNGKIYSIGGWDGTNYLTIVEEHDPVENKWQRKTDIPTQRISFSTSAVNGKIYAIGGVIRGGQAVSAVEEYDPQAGESIEFKGKLPTTWGEVRTASSK